MKWHLTVDIRMKEAFRLLEHSHALVSIGSCFSENIGSIMARQGWNISNNPFGILYNPLSVAAAVQRLLEGRQYEHADLFHHQGLCGSMDHHSRFSGTDPEVVLNGINKAFDEAVSGLKQGSTLISTFGTAFCYTVRATGRVAGNCHKLPAGDFDRRRMGVQEILDTYEKLIEDVGQVNSGLQWVFTVSPVRHWKDGAADNMWSKAVLICAVRELAERYDQVHYFPSYEIMMDELRDHRFYAEDLLHPSVSAIQHIWSRFASSCLSSAARETGDKVRRVRERLEHRPLHADSTGYAEFLSRTEEMVRDIRREYPYIQW